MGHQHHSPSQHMALMRLKLLAIDIIFTVNSYYILMNVLNTLFFCCFELPCGLLLAVFTLACACSLSFPCSCSPLLFQDLVTTILLSISRRQTYNEIVNCFKFQNSAPFLPREAILSPCLSVSHSKIRKICSLLIAFLREGERRRMYVVCAHVYMCIEINLRYVIQFPLSFLRQGLVTKELPELPKLQGSSCVHLPSHGNYRCAPTHGAFCVSSGIQTQVFMSNYRHFTDRPHPPNPIAQFLYITSHLKFSNFQHFLMMSLQANCQHSGDTDHVLFCSKSYLI